MMVASSSSVGVRGDGRIHLDGTFRFTGAGFQMPFVLRCVWADTRAREEYVLWSWDCRWRLQADRACLPASRGERNAKKRCVGRTGQDKEDDSKGVALPRRGKGNLKKNLVAQSRRCDDDGRLGQMGGNPRR